MNYENVIYENIGLSSEKGTSQIYIPVNSETSPSATLNAKTDDFTSYDIKTDTLDNYFYENEINLSFLKIDVEGHELEVLKGGENLIKENPLAILMECEERHLKSHSVFDVFSFLNNHGYEGHFFFNNKLVSINNFDLEKHQKLESSNPYVNNFLFRK